MHDVLYVDDLEAASALLKPARLDLLRRLDTPRSCSELAAEVGESTQRVYYHVKTLERTGLVEKVAERRVRGIHEGLYRAAARSYWLSPELVGRVGGRERAGERLSLGFVLDLAEELQADVARLVQEHPDEDVPSVGVDARVRLRPEQREAFLRDVEKSIERLSRKYGDNRTGEDFRIVLACYPRRNP